MDPTYDVRVFKQLSNVRLVYQISDLYLSFDGPDHVEVLLFFVLFAFGDADLSDAVVPVVLPDSVVINLEFVVEFLGVCLVNGKCAIRKLV